MAKTSRVLLSSVIAAGSGPCLVLRVLLVERYSQGIYRKDSCLQGTPMHRTIPQH